MKLFRRTHDGKVVEVPNPPLLSMFQLMDRPDSLLLSYDRLQPNDLESGDTVLFVMGKQDFDPLTAAPAECQPEKLIRYSVSFGLH